MERKKEDRRVKYTKRVIKDSFIRLLEEKPVARITVKEICELSDIHRSTFYIHYVDIYDLLRQIEREVLEKVNSYLHDFNFRECEPKSFQIMKCFFTFMAENEKLCRVLLGENGDISLQKEIMLIVQRQLMSEHRDRKIVSKKAMEYLSLYGVNVCVGITQKWLEGGLQEPAHKMAELVIQLIYYGLSSLPRRKLSGEAGNFGEAR